MAHRDGNQLVERMPQRWRKSVALVTHEESSDLVVEADLREKMTSFRRSPDRMYPVLSKEIQQGCRRLPAD